MSGMQGTVTITVSEFMSLQERIKTAENEAADLRKQLGAASLVDPSGRVPVLVDTIRTIMTVAQFAVANLPPETKGWPVAEVKKLACGISALPDVTTAEAEMAIDLISFAAEIDEVLRARAERIHARKLIEAADLGMPEPAAAPNS
jgi:hypothetical protein